MVSEAEAVICPEGFMCPPGTNNQNLKLCSQGYYCGLGVISEENASICSEGYYCDAGTSDQNKEKYVCLTGFFCPNGSYSKLEEETGLRVIYSAFDSDKFLSFYLKNCPNEAEYIDIVISFLVEQSFILKCPIGTNSFAKSQCISECFTINEKKVVRQISAFDLQKKERMCFSNKT